MKKRPDLSLVMSYLWPDPKSKGNPSLAQKLLNEWGFEAVEFGIGRIRQRYKSTLNSFSFVQRLFHLRRVLNYNWYISESELQSGQYPAKMRAREWDAELTKKFEQK